jgi:hypothetical protein
MSTHILIDPADLRDAAHSCEAIGTSLREIHARLRVPVPAMPSDLAARVRHEVDDAVRDVGEQGDYLGEEAIALRRRAEWTEKADRGGWTALLDLFDIFGLGGVSALSDRFGKPSRPDLDGVLRDYQVADDEMKEWEPGWPLSLLTEPKVLTVTEAGLLNGLSGLKQRDFKNIADDAFAESEARYGGHTPYETNDGHQDAFRHTYWNTLMTRKFGETFARKYTTAHEGVPGNQGPREAMDLYNNEVGRRIASEHPDADEKELARLVQDAVDGGDVVVIDHDLHLAYSDQVAVGQHGDANAAAPIGGGKPAEAGDSGDAKSHGTGS